MNVYDFDGTIYKGDSTIDFYLFVLKRHPGILRHLPAFCGTAVRHKIKKCSTKELKTCFFRFLSDISDVEYEVGQFWETHFQNIMPWYFLQKQETDVIISASPVFLLKKPCQMLGVRTLIASHVDVQTGAFLSENCKGEEKVRRFREKYPYESVDQFYSDSFSDLPMAKIAEKSFLIHNGCLKPWNTRKGAHL